jgi:hypothetical protein
MHNLDQTELTTVVGGTTRATNDQITQQLTALQTSIKDVASNTTSSGGNNTFMLLAMMMAMRPQQPTVVAAGAPVAAAPSSVVNISTRVRRW